MREWNSAWRFVTFTAVADAAVHVQLSSLHSDIVDYFSCPVDAARVSVRVHALWYYGFAGQGGRWIWNALDENCITYWGLDGMSLQASWKKHWMDCPRRFDSAGAVDYIGAASPAGFAISQQ